MVRFRTDFQGYAVRLEGWPRNTHTFSGRYATGGSFSISLARQVEFSPFEDGKLACATSQYFGIIGNGRQFVLGTRTGRPEMAVLGCFDSRVILLHVHRSRCSRSDLRRRRTVCTTAHGARATTTTWSPLVAMAR
jgi:hypothetical protein